MTLTQWIRGYLFNPLTRALRRKKKLSAPLIIFITQMTTMLVIGCGTALPPICHLGRLARIGAVHP